MSSVHGVDQVQQHIQHSHTYRRHAHPAQANHTSDGIARTSPSTDPPQPIHQIKALFELRMEHVAMFCDSSPSPNAILAKFDLDIPSTHLRPMVEGSEVCG